MIFLYDAHFLPVSLLTKANQNTICKRRDKPVMRVSGTAHLAMIQTAPASDPIQPSSNQPTAIKS
jgi:hypothetical protein